MSRSWPKRVLPSWLLHRLGPPPPPPGHYVSRRWNYDAHRAAAILDTDDPFGVAYMIAFIGPRLLRRGPHVTR